MPPSPQPFPVRFELKMATDAHGYCIKQAEVNGWRRFDSVTARESIDLAAANDLATCYLAVEHRGVMAEVHFAEADIGGPGARRYAFAGVTALRAGIQRVYRLATSLPDGHLHDFLAYTRTLPRATDAERLTVQRLGQGIFRQPLLAYRDHRCRLTGIAEAAMLRTSRIKPRADCASDEERLDVHNGLLFSSLGDAAFDAGWVSFRDSGDMINTARLSRAAYGRLTDSETRYRLPLLTIATWNGQAVARK